MAGGAAPGAPTGAGAMALVHEGCDAWEKTQQATFVDFCLAPGGRCLCEERLRQQLQQGPAQEPAGCAVEQCWRVRVPWWSQSGLMLPDNVHQQAARQERGDQAPGAHDRVRTPSPEPCYERSTAAGLLPPVLRVAPPLPGAPPCAMGELCSGAPDVALCRTDRRRGSEGGARARRGAQVTVRVEYGDEDWETASHVSELSVSSLASSRGPRRTSGPVYVAEHLHWLESQDASKVFRLKRIHKLGFDAPAVLEAYFKQWGPVEQVLLSNTPVNMQGQPADKPSRSSGVRVRPAGMGWVVMSNPEDVERLLECSSHVVQGLAVSVLRYTPRAPVQTPPSSIDSIEEEDEADLDLLLPPPCTGRRLWSEIF